MITYVLHRPGRRVLVLKAVLTLGGFLFGTVAPPFASAAIWEERKKNIAEEQHRTRQVHSAVQSHSTESTEKPDFKNPLGIKVPEEYGSVVESWTSKISDNNVQVYHIQDVHGHYAAQKNSAAILKGIVNGELGMVNSKDQKPLNIFIEGAWGRVRPDWLSVFPDESAKLSAAESLLKQGSLTGEEYFAVTNNPGSVEIQGIEDRDVYEANLKSRTLLDAERKSAVRQVNRLQSRLKTIKQRLYSRDLMELDDLFHRHETDDVTLKEYAGIFKSKHKKIWNSPDYRNLQLFMEAAEMEEDSAFAGVEIEVKNLLATLEGKLDKQTLARLAEQALQYRISRKGPDQYFSTLKNISSVFKIPMPKTEQYILYLQKAAGIDPEKLAGETRLIEKTVFENFAQTNPQVRQAIELTLALRMQEKFWQEQFSPQDWAEYQQSKNSIPIKKMEDQVRGLEQSMGLRSLAQEPELQFTSVNGAIKLRPTPGQMKYLQEAYYKLAFKRNETMMKNFLEKTKSETRPVVLIAGGFHTAGLTHLLRANKISYAVIRPKLSVTTTDQPMDNKKEIYSATIAEYLRRLEALKDKADAGYSRRIDEIIDLVRTRVILGEPRIKGDRGQISGAYQGKQARVNFIMEYVKQTGTGSPTTVAGIHSELLDSMKTAKGTLRLGPLSGDETKTPATVAVIEGAAKLPGFEFTAMQNREEEAEPEQNPDPPLVSASAADTFTPAQRAVALAKLVRYAVKPNGLLEYSYDELFGPGASLTRVKYVDTIRAIYKELIKNGDPVKALRVAVTKDALHAVVTALKKLIKLINQPENPLIKKLQLILDELVGISKELYTEKSGFAKDDLDLEKIKFMLLEEYHLDPAQRGQHPYKPLNDFLRHEMGITDEVIAQVKQKEAKLNDAEIVRSMITDEKIVQAFNKLAHFKDLFSDKYMDRLQQRLPQAEAINKERLEEKDANSAENYHIRDVQFEALEQYLQQDTPVSALLRKEIFGDEKMSEEIGDLASHTDLQEKAVNALNKIAKMKGLFKFLSPGSFKRDMSIEALERQEAKLLEDRKAAEEHLEPLRQEMNQLTTDRRSKTDLLKQSKENNDKHKKEVARLQKELETKQSKDEAKSRRDLKANEEGVQSTDREILNRTGEIDKILKAIPILNGKIKPFEARLEEIDGQIAALNKSKVNEQVMKFNRVLLKQMFPQAMVQRPVNWNVRLIQALYPHNPKKLRAVGLFNKEPFAAVVHILGGYALGAVYRSPFLPGQINLDALKDNESIFPILQGTLEDLKQPLAQGADLTEKQAVDGLNKMLESPDLYQLVFMTSKLKLSSEAKGILDDARSGKPIPLEKLQSFNKQFLIAAFPNLFKVKVRLLTDFISRKDVDKFVQILNQRADIRRNKMAAERKMVPAKNQMKWKLKEMTDTHVILSVGGQTDIKIEIPDIVDMEETKTGAGLLADLAGKVMASKQKSAEEPKATQKKDFGEVVRLAMQKKQEAEEKKSVPEQPIVMNPLYESDDASIRATWMYFPETKTFGVRMQNFVSAAMKASIFTLIEEADEVMARMEQQAPALVDAEYRAIESAIRPESDAPPGTPAVSKQLQDLSEKEYAQFMALHKLAADTFESAKKEFQSGFRSLGFEPLEYGEILEDLESKFALGVRGRPETKTTAAHKAVLVSFRAKRNKLQQNQKVQIVQRLDAIEAEFKRAVNASAMELPFSESDIADLDLLKQELKTESKAQQAVMSKLQGVVLDQANREQILAALNGALAADDFSINDKKAALIKVFPTGLKQREYLFAGHPVVLGNLKMTLKRVLVWISALRWGITSSSAEELKSDPDLFPSDFTNNLDKMPEDFVEQFYAPDFEEPDNPAAEKKAAPKQRRKSGRKPKVKKTQANAGASLPLPAGHNRDRSFDLAAKRGVPRHTQAMNLSLPTVPGAIPKDASETVPSLNSPRPWNARNIQQKELEKFERMRKARQDYSPTPSPRRLGEQEQSPMFPKIKNAANAAGRYESNSGQVTIDLFSLVFTTLARGGYLERLLGKSAAESISPIRDALSERLGRMLTPADLLTEASILALMDSLEHIMALTAEKNAALTAAIFSLYSSLFYTRSITALVMDQFLFIVHILTGTVRAQLTTPEMLRKLIRSSLDETAVSGMEVRIVSGGTARMDHISPFSMLGQFIANENRKSSEQEKITDVEISDYNILFLRNDGTTLDVAIADYINTQGYRHVLYSNDKNFVKATWTANADLSGTQAVIQSYVLERGEMVQVLSEEAEEGRVYLRTLQETNNEALADAEVRRVDKTYRDLEDIRSRTESVQAAEFQSALPAAMSAWTAAMMPAVMTAAMIQTMNPSELWTRLPMERQAEILSQLNDEHGSAQVRIIEDNGTEGFQIPDVLLNTSGTLKIQFTAGGIRIAVSGGSLLQLHRLQTFGNAGANAVQRALFVHRLGLAVKFGSLLQQNFIHGKPTDWLRLASEPAVLVELFTDVIRSSFEGRVVAKESLTHELQKIAQALNESTVAAGQNPIMEIVDLRTDQEHQNRLADLSKQILAAQKTEAAGEKTVIYIIVSDGSETASSAAQKLGIPVEQIAVVLQTPKETVSSTQEIDAAKIVLTAREADWKEYHNYFKKILDIGALLFSNIPIQNLTTHFDKLKAEFKLIATQA